MKIYFANERKRRKNYLNRKRCAPDLIGKDKVPFSSFLCRKCRLASCLTLPSFLFQSTKDDIRYRSSIPLCLSSMHTHGIYSVAKLPSVNAKRDATASRYAIYKRQTSIRNGTKKSVKIKQRNKVTNQHSKTLCLRSVCSHPFLHSDFNQISRNKNNHKRRDEKSEAHARKVGVQSAKA